MFLQSLTPLSQQTLSALQCCLTDLAAQRQKQCPWTLDTHQRIAAVGFWMPDVLQAALCRALPELLLPLLLLQPLRLAS
jgi:hypothetical protein